MTYVLAVLAPLSIAAPLAPWGASAAQAAAKASPNTAAVWFVAPGGAASAPCGTTKATACALINTAIGEATAGDTIRVAAGTYTATAASDLAVVTKDLTVTGPGAGTTTLDGNSLGTTLTVDPGVTATVKGFTITGGTGTATSESGTPAQVGGGVFNEGTLTLTNDTVTGNHVSVTASGANAEAVADGGGVFNADGGTLLVTHCQVTSNSVTATAKDSAIAEAIGGGVSSFANLESPTSQTAVEDSTISGNSAKATGDSPVDAEVSGSGTAAGGGIGTIHSSDRSPVSGDTISGNTATGLGTGSSFGNASGAGVFEVDSDTADAIADSHIIDNTARAVSTGTNQSEVLAAGIAVAASNDGHALVDSVVRGNTAASRATGGGEAETVSSGAGALASLTADAVMDSTISGNKATAVSNNAGNAIVGGAAIGAAAATMANAISDSVINNNRSIAKNTGTGSASAEGAIVAVESPIVGSQISGNKAKATATGSNPDAPVQAAAAGGAILDALNAVSGSKDSPISTSSLTGNVVTASYTGTGSGLAQAAGGAIGATTGISDSKVLSNRATATGSGTGVLTTGLPSVGTAASPVTLNRAGSRADLAGLPSRTGLPGVAGLTARLTSAVATLEVRPFSASKSKRSLARPADTTMLASAIAGAGGIDGLTGPATSTTISDNQASATSTGQGIAFTQGAGISIASQLVAVTVTGNVATATGPAGSSVLGGGVGTSASMANSTITGNSPTDCGAPTGVDGGGNHDSDGTCGVANASG
ncbi:MAG TPA: hypothetical protein VFI65_00440 [Streptosporangiaceae bacterium]|nr:hypothetical protein [Streptosporangiaceae bacterium]